MVRVGLATLTLTLTVFGQNVDDSVKNKKPDAAMERSAYDGLQQCSREHDCDKKLALARELLAKYPNSQYALYIKLQITTAYDCQFQQALTKKDFQAAIEVGRALRVVEPYNLLLHTLLSEIYVELVKQGYNKYIDDGREITLFTIELYKDDRPLPISGDHWDRQRDRQKYRSQMLAELHGYLAIFSLAENNTAEAIAVLDKAIEYDCSNAKIYALLISAYRQEYKDLSNKYLRDEYCYGNMEKERLIFIYANLNSTLESYGKLISLSNKNDTPQLRQEITEIYNFLYDNPEMTLDQFLSKYREFCKPKY